MARHKSSSNTRSGVCLSCSNLGWGMGTSLAFATRHACVAACSMPFVRLVLNGCACFISVLKTARTSSNAKISSSIATCSAPMASRAGNATLAGTPPDPTPSSLRPVCAKAPRGAPAVRDSPRVAAVKPVMSAKDTDGPPFALSSAVSVALTSALRESFSAPTAASPLSLSSSNPRSASANTIRLFSSSVTTRTVPSPEGVDTQPRCSTTTAYCAHRRSAEFSFKRKSVLVFATSVKKRGVWSRSLARESVVGSFVKKGFADAVLSVFSSRNGS
mmetsp:Transcript_6680/g.25182  ORF Transcript_6680/g.25182 Transcript_6680/m.25182 type:complete len:274 (-) Transcript_6680:683-1504(-)